MPCLAFLNTTNAHSTLHSTPKNSTTPPGWFLFDEYFVTKQIESKFFFNRYVLDPDNMQ